MEAIRINYRDVRLSKDDLTFFDTNTKGMFFDADSNSLVMFDPSQILLDELDARGIKYEWLKPEEVERCLADYFG